uniref:Uncharacterized protein n=1 Tax=Arundo donax TaxID=35708 RepID=A0A0A9DD10_ARUDO
MPYNFICYSWCKNNFILSSLRSTFSFIYLNVSLIVISGSSIQA